ncbi:MAG TPA: hypothetical protein VFE27_07545 [Acidobacteriaceae bacterium]|nr:hypothetical protein [Acidobacteriaceae bacterium]
MKSLKKYLVVASLLAGSIAVYGQTSLIGKWHGTDNNLPIIDLNIEQNAGQATGSAIFYMIKRNSDGGNPYVGGQASGPMENLKYAPEKLTFDMHRKDGSLLSFRVEQVDATHAKLFRTSDDAPEGTGFPLIRVNP